MRPRFLGIACPPPLLSRVPSSRVPARRFKDPWGGRPSVPGVGGGGGARRWGGKGGRSVREDFPVPPRPALFLSPTSELYGLPLPPLPFPEAAVGSCGGVESPLWAPGGARPARRLAPLLCVRWSRLPAPGAGRPRVVGFFLAPRPFFFFFFHTCLFRFSLTGPRRTPPPSIRSLSPRRRRAGRRGGGIVPSVSTVSPLTPSIPIRLLAVDHSARASMKNAASCEN